MAKNKKKKMGISPNDYDVYAINRRTAKVVYVDSSVSDGEGSHYCYEVDFDLGIPNTKKAPIRIRNKDLIAITAFLPKEN